MLFKIDTLEEYFKERLITDTDSEYYITKYIKELALKEFMRKHHTIDLHKRGQR